MKALRADLKVIARMIPPGASVLDVGCGDGELLSWLQREKQVRGRGIEISQAGVSRCIAQGLAVIQGNADTDLEYYPDGAVEYVILSQTLQTLQAPKRVMEELVRIGRHAIVSVPNFGHWKNRCYLMFRGRMPVTRALSYAWYDTPNIHFCTISDFVELCDALELDIERRLYVTAQGAPAIFHRKGLLANLLGQQGVFMLRKR